LEGVAAKGSWLVTSVTRGEGTKRSATHRGGRQFGAKLGRYFCNWGNVINTNTKGFERSIIEGRAIESQTGEGQRMIVANAGSQRGKIGPSNQFKLS